MLAAYTSFAKFHCHTCTNPALLHPNQAEPLKVDAPLVGDTGTDPNDEAIIRPIIAMTHSLKLNVVAEGVETEDQYRVLRDLECDEYQGYFFSKPLPPAEFEAEFLDLQ